MSRRLIAVYVAIAVAGLAISVGPVQSRYKFGDWFPSNPPQRLVECGGAHYYPVKPSSLNWDRDPARLPVIDNDPFGHPIRGACNPSCRSQDCGSPMEIYLEVAPGRLAGYVRGGGP